MKQIWIIRRKKNKNTCETLLTNLTILWEELIDVIMFFRGYIMINFKMINVTRHVSLNHFSSRIYPLYIYLNWNSEIFNYSYICLHAHEIFKRYFIHLYIYIFHKSYAWFSSAGVFKLPLSNTVQQQLIFSYHVSIFHPLKKTPALQIFYKKSYDSKCLILLVFQDHYVINL